MQDTEESKVGSMPKIQELKFLKDKQSRVYVDVSATIYSGLKTGIQRVVRNVVKWSSETNGSCSLVIPVVVFRGIIFEIKPDIVQIDNSTLIDIGSRAKIQVESSRARIRQKLDRNRGFGWLFLDLFELGDWLLRVYFRILKYSRVFYFILRSGWKTVKPGAQDTFLFLDMFWFINLPLLFKKSLKNCGSIQAVVYDIIPLTHEEVVEDEGKGLFSHAFNFLIKRVDGLLTISKSVADDVTQYLKRSNFQRPELKISHFYLGADFGPRHEVSKDCVRPELSQFLMSQTGPIWLIVGTIEPRKNHQFVLDSFDEIWNENRPDALIIIGKVGWKCEMTIDRIQRHHQYGKKLIYLKDCDDSELQYCYSIASGLIFASICEGFGLPLLEAMFYGLPVVCSDIPVFREIGGNYPSYFDLSSNKTLKEQIANFDTKKNVRSPHIDITEVLTWKESSRLLMKKLHEQRHQHNNLS